VLQHEPHPARKNPHSDGLVGESEPAFRRSQGLAASRSFCEFKVKWVPVLGGVWYLYGRKSSRER
jgi:hypothetical protein